MLENHPSDGELPRQPEGGGAGQPPGAARDSGAGHL